MVYILVLLAIAIGLAIGRKYSPKNKLHKCLTAILLPIISGIVIALFFAALNNSPFDFWYKLGQAMAPVLFAIVAMIITLFISLKVKGSKGNDSTLIKQQVQKLHYGVGENRVDFEMELTEQEIAMMEEMRKQDPEKWKDNELELVKAARKALADNDSLQEVVSQESMENNTMEKVVQKLHYGTGDNRVDFEMELTKREIEKMEELRQRKPERWLDNDLELVKAAKKELMNGDSVQEEILQETLNTSEVRSEATDTQEEPLQEEKIVVEPVLETKVMPTQDNNEESRDKQSKAETQIEVKLMPEKKEKKGDGNTLSKRLKVLLIVILSLGVMFGLSVLASIMYINYVYPSKAKSDDKKLIQESKANPTKAYEIAQELFKRDENGHVSEYHDFISGKQGVCDLDHAKAGMEVASIYCQYCIDSAKMDVVHSAHIARDMLFQKNDGYCDDLYNTTGVEILKRGAEEGDATAQFALGCYYGGCEYNKEGGWNDYYTLDGKTIDRAKAAYWYLQAANQGNATAMGNLGNAYMYGKGVVKDEIKGLELIQEAANNDNAWYQRVLGDYYRDGVQMKVGTHKERRKDTDGYSYSSKDKINEYWDDYRMEWVTVYLIDVADYKTILPKDIKQAQYWWKKAADNGDETAKERLQQIYE